MNAGHLCEKQIAVITQFRKPEKTKQFYMVTKLNTMT